MQLSTVMRSVDGVVREVLKRGGVVRPPVDAICVAEELGVVVALDAGQQGRARQAQIAGASAIFLRPDDRPERIQWSAAHELGEVFARDVFAGLGRSDEEFQPEFREQVANIFASRFLLPAGWFEHQAQAVDADLFQLKSIFATASHELIAMRLLDMPEPSVVTVFDQGKLTRRKGAGPGVPPRLLPAERRCQRKVHESGLPSRCIAEGILVCGWPVNESGWKREILRAISTAEDES